MYRKLIALPFALLLAACGREEPPKALECANPAVLQGIRGNIQETLTQEARSFAREDGRAVCRCRQNYRRRLRFGVFFGTRFETQEARAHVLYRRFEHYRAV